jgi:hypothetical protein
MSSEHWEIPITYRGLEDVQLITETSSTNKHEIKSSFSRIVASYLGYLIAKIRKICEKDSKKTKKSKEDL